MPRTPPIVAAVAKCEYDACRLSRLIAAPAPRNALGVNTSTSPAVTLYLAFLGYSSPIGYPRRPDASTTATSERLDRRRLVQVSTNVVGSKVHSLLPRNASIVPNAMAAPISDPKPVATASASVMLRATRTPIVEPVSPPMNAPAYWALSSAW